MFRKLVLGVAIFLAIQMIGTVSAGSMNQTTGDDCSAIARSALDAVQAVCGDTGRNQVCYGNISIDAEASDSATNFAFEKAGDIADLSDISSLRLKTLDYFSDEWGVALLRVQASLPDDAPQNVTMLLFGNVNIANDGVGELVNLPVATTTASNVRLSPSSNGPVLGSVTASAELVANGRITNGIGEEWIRVQFDRGPGGVGWVWGNLITTAGDRNTLVELESQNARPYGPMQAFTFTSGQDDRPCTTAPDSGILIQTPAGVGEINFLINEVDIRVGSTVFLQNVPNRNMAIRTLEGRVLTTVDSVTRLVPQGSQINIPVDENGSVSGPLGMPEPYDLDELDELDLALDEDFFEEDIDIEFPLDEAFMDEFNDYFNDGEYDALFDLLLEDEFSDDFDIFFDALLNGDLEADEFDIFVEDYFEEEFEDELGALIEEALEPDFIEDEEGAFDDFSDESYDDEFYDDGEYDDDEEFYSDDEYYDDESYEDEDYYDEGEADDDESF